MDDDDDDADNEGDISDEIADAEREERDSSRYN